MRLRRSRTVSGSVGSSLNVRSRDAWGYIYREGILTLIVSLKEKRITGSGIQTCIYWMYMYTFESRWLVKTKKRITNNQNVYNKFVQPGRSHEINNMYRTTLTRYMYYCRAWLTLISFGDFKSTTLVPRSVPFSKASFTNRSNPLRNISALVCVSAIEERYMSFRFTRLTT